jgi:hypothetical protein
MTDAVRQGKQRCRSHLSFPSRAIRAYLKARYGIDLGSLNPEEEAVYWREFGLRVQEFLAFAEPVAVEMYWKSFVNLKQSEQAEVIRRVARDRDE